VTAFCLDRSGHTIRSTTGFGEVKNQTILDAVTYAQQHGGEIIKALGLDPQSGEAIQAINARIQTALNDPKQPTPEAITPPSGLPSRGAAP